MKKLGRPSSNLNHRTAVRLDDELLRIATEIATEEHCELSEAIRRMLKESASFKRAKQKEAQVADLGLQQVSIAGIPVYASQESARKLGELFKMLD